MGDLSDITLLIVDDSPIIIERLLESLKDHETVTKILTAEGYDQAVEIMKNRVPDIMLLDIHLAGQSGIDLLKLIVTDYPQVEVVMFSNLLDENYIKSCAKIGAKYFVDKSKEFELVPQLLNKILSGKKNT